MERLCDIPIRYCKGVGPKRQESFSRAGIGSIEDLLYYFPKRYEDRTTFTPIYRLEPGQVYTIKATVILASGRRSFRRRGFSITEAKVDDKTGRLQCVWFNQPYLKNYLVPGTEVILYGKADIYAGKLQMHNPEFEVLKEDSDASLNSGRIVPVYRLPQGIGQRSMRKLIRQVIDGHISKLADFLPYDIRTRNNLLNIAQSIINIHFPEDPQLQMEAYTRLAFEEFLLFQLPLVLRKRKRHEKPGIAHSIRGRLVEGFLKGLEFELTASQKNVLEEIKQDMQKPLAMQRLLQGDVGSGKTVVAATAAMMAIQGGYQAAIMAPTEILAHQHYEKIKAQAKDVCVGLLTSSGPKDKREKTIERIRKGQIQLVIGTHALLQEDVLFANLGLVVIDEQHKFGVGQRALLPQKGKNPDVLIMTATPIPRTLAITLYGDLDVSVITQLPPGRPRINTSHFKQQDRSEAYQIARQQVACGNQVFIVYPVIEDSYALDIAGAVDMYESFKSGEFKDLRVGLIHGKLSQRSQEDVMLAFKQRQLDILVATTVLEVGIDVPTATCMIVEHADRFGLSQLHQLRGRVGRGSADSYCILISDASTQDAVKRMEAMVAFRDGFHIAEEDLKIRGPGEYFGSRQHGLTGLRIGNPLAQMQLLKRAREEAVRLIGQDPRLEDRSHTALREKLLQRFPEYEKLMLVG